MPKIYVYNPSTNEIESYTRGLLEAMPYIYGKTMTVGEFKANSITNILWTDKRMLDAWNNFRSGWGKPIFIGYAFKRIWEGGHAGQSQHYAGLALDIGHTLTAVEREKLRAYASTSGYWTYVEPASISPRWVHVDKRFGTPACPAGGFPEVSLGSKGMYVFILQDSLMAAGYTTLGLTGVFDDATAATLARYQTANGLPVTRKADCATWVNITNKVNGIGVPSTVII